MRRVQFCTAWLRPSCINLYGIVPVSLMVAPKPAIKKSRGFNPALFLETAAKGRIVVAYPAGEVIYTQGDDADAVFYVRRGRVKVTVLSMLGKEAVIALLNADEFFGEGCLIGQLQRLSTAAAMTECEIMQVDKTEMTRVLQDEPAFSNMLSVVLSDRSAARSCGNAVSLKATPVRVVLAAV